MKTKMFIKCLLGILPVLVLFYSGSAESSEAGGVTQIYKKATVPFDDLKRVHGLVAPPGQIVAVKIPYQGGRFWTETRKDKMERFKCSQCHNNKTVQITKAAEMAHGDIQLDHGGKDKPLSCFTCHKRDERDFLVNERDEKVDLDHAYELCGQCHFRQAKDWVGGAHGKRVANWAGQRVVKNCTACHDPHSPLFKKRWPKTYSPPFE